MLSLSIRFRKSTKKGCHSGRLVFRVIHERKTTEVISSFLIYDSEWDITNNRILYPKDDADRKKELEEIDKNVTAEKTELTQQLHRMIAAGNFDISKVSTINRLRTSKNSFRRFVDFVASEHLLNNKFRAAGACTSLKNRLMKFMKGADFSLDSIDASFVKNFETILKADKLSLNTISFYLRNLRSIYNKAILEKRIPGAGIDIFKGVYTGVETTKKRALTPEEIQTLRSFDIGKYMEKSLANKSLKTISPKTESDLQLAQDMFNFSFLSRGMSFVDLVYLKKTDIKRNMITYSRQKTNQKLEIELTKDLLEIINKYMNPPTPSPFLFPVIKRTSAQDQYKDYTNGLMKQNKSLKVLSKLSGVVKNVSTHVARHSWATIAKKENIPLWVISEALGHASLKTTTIYLDSFDVSRLSEANRTVYRAVMSSRS